MDCISNKIAIEFKLNTSKRIDHTLVESHNYKILADIEGELTIYINGELFFYEEFILLMELGVEFAKWLESVRLGINKDFHYQTMDYNEGPILEFTKIKNDNWKLFSIWQKFEVNESFFLPILQKAVNTFLSKLTKELETQYKININTYL